MGEGAIISCLSKFLHPSQHIRDKYVNQEKGHRLDGLIALREDKKTIRRRIVDVIVMVHPDFQENDDFIELYACPRYCKITQERPKDKYFNI